MVMPVINAEQKTGVKLNKQLDVAGADGSVLSNLIAYMGINEDDTKLAIEKMLNSKSMDSKSIKRFLKKGMIIFSKDLSHRRTWRLTLE